jgi:hypothetical protein
MVCKRSSTGVADKRAAQTYIELERKRSRWQRQVDNGGLSVWSSGSRAV